MNAIANLPMGLHAAMIFTDEDDHSSYTDSPTSTHNEDPFAPWDFAVNAFAPGPDFQTSGNPFGGMMDTQQSLLMASAAANTLAPYQGAIAAGAEAAASALAAGNKRKSPPAYADYSSESGESVDEAAESGGAVAKRKRTSRSTRLSPEEKLRRKLERQVARRQRKSIREKERRNSVNVLFEEMTKMLGLPKECSDRRTVLSKAIRVFEKLGADMITTVQKEEPTVEPSAAVKTN